MTPNELIISQKLADFRNRNATLKLPNGFTPKVPFMQHQIIGFWYCIKLPNIALLYEMGLGKSCIAVNACRYRLEKGEVSKVLVVCPKNVLYGWQDEITKHSNLRSTILYDTTRDKKLERFKTDAEFYIINFDGVAIFLEELIQMQFDTIILDESTRIKNCKTLRTKSIFKLAKEIPYKMCLSGFPVTNSPMDIFTQMDVLDHSVFDNKNFWQWRYRYFKDIGVFYPNFVPRRGALEEIQRRIYTLGVRYEKKDCLKLPDKIFLNQYIELNAEQTEAYNRIENKLTVHLGEKTVKVAFVITQILRLTQIESGFLKTDKVEDEEGEIIDEGEILDLGSTNPKITLLDELLDDLLYDDHKVVIWCRFIYSLKLVETLLKKKKIGHSLYYGTVKDSDRKVAVSNFQTDANVKVFVGQIHSGGVGITLTAADNVIYFELTESVEDYYQSQDRTHRIGSERWNSINYYHFLRKGGISEKTLEALQTKQSIAKLITERKKI